jgi:hypothetical chaperone protein
MRLGIDFGTTNSGVGLFDGEHLRILPIEQKARDAGVARTLLYLTRDGQVQMGQAAIDVYYEQNIGRARSLVKKVVGEIEVIAAEMFFVRDVHVMEDELTPGRLFQSLKSGLKEASFSGTDVFGRHYKLEELIALYLDGLRKRASEIVGQRIAAVVLGRPVNFGSDASLNAMAAKRLRTAAELAGFDDITFELEPVAAALAYERSIDRPQNILVFDFGGGTLDLTVMRVGGQERQVLATGGIDLAGDVFDREIIRYRLLDHFGQGTTVGEHNLPFPAHLTAALTHWQEIPALSTPKTLRLLDEAQRNGSHPSRVRALESLVVNNYGFALFDAVERAKRQLSDGYSAVIRLQAKEIDLWQMLTRTQFEAIISGHRSEISARVQDTVRRSGLMPDEIDAVVRTGGSSQIPCFVVMLAEQFGAEKLRLESTFSGVTAGLAIRAWELDRGYAKQVDHLI